MRSHDLRGGRARARLRASAARAALALCGLAAWAAPAGAAEPLERRGLEQLTLEELMQVPVTSVAGQRRALWGTPAAIYVLTGEEIRRSGHRSIAEVLRLVPGMFVGRESAQSWIVGARGLTGLNLTSTRHLVLLDGRVVYDPLFSGTLWDSIDVVFEDIDRIEVIRGPGATLWGANAMNGVIRILTKSADRTRGTYATLAAGDTEPVHAAVRYGAALSERADFRVWAKYREYDAFDRAAGGTNHDEWSDARGGFRLDGRGVDGAEWSLIGGGHRHPEFRNFSVLPVPGRHLESEAVLSDDEVEGADLLFRVARGVDRAAGWNLKAYYDYRDRDTSRLGFRRDTFELDLRRWTRRGERHQILWGAQVDHTSDRVENRPTFLFEPDRRAWTIANAFLQDTIEISPGRWFAMVGSKLTYHDFVGLEVQPSVRLWFTPDDRRMAWAAISRPVRIPSRLEQDGTIVLAYADTGLVAGGPPSGVVAPFGISGDDDLDSEELIAYEAGGRFRLGERWTLDASAFYNDYSRLISIPPGILGTFSNAGTGESHGADVAASWRPRADCRIEGSVSWLEVDVDGPVFPLDEGSTPEWMAQVRALIDLRPDLELDAALSHVGRLERSAVPSYERLDVGVVWRTRRGLELSLRGQNLLDGGHVETSSSVAVPRNLVLRLAAAF